mmetsp:Transcript_31757/g.93203  ORF Transcript_31757/g.93203 Transcript_31757/m.93203 type:complete len:205 (-) Transcript_31757:328-942(-)
MAIGHRFDALTSRKRHGQIWHQTRWIASIVHHLTYHIFDILGIGSIHEAVFKVALHHRRLAFQQRRVISMGRSIIGGSIIRSRKRLLEQTYIVQGWPGKHNSICTRSFLHGGKIVSRVKISIDDNWYRLHRLDRLDNIHESIPLGRLLRFVSNFPSVNGNGIGTRLDEGTDKVDRRCIILQKANFGTDWYVNIGTERFDNVART